MAETNDLTARFRKVAWGKLHWDGHESILPDDVCIVADGSEIIHYKSLDAFVADLEEWEMWEAIVKEDMGEE